MSARMSALDSALHQLAQAVEQFGLDDGMHDLLATPDVAQRYYDSITAPAKHLVVLEHAGHDPNQDVIDAEYKLLKERILPLAK